MTRKHEVFEIEPNVFVYVAPTIPQDDVDELLRRQRATHVDTEDCLCWRCFFQEFEDPDAPACSFSVEVGPNVFVRYDPYRDPKPGHADGSGDEPRRR